MNAYDIYPDGIVDSMPPHCGAVPIMPNNELATSPAPLGEDRCRTASAVGAADQRRPVGQDRDRYAERAYLRLLNDIPGSIFYPIRELQSSTREMKP